MEKEQVVEKILAEANQEAEQILGQAREKVSDAQAKLQTELEAYRAETGTLAEKSAKDRSDRILAAARMDIRKELNASKISLLGEVFVGAKDRIKSLDDDSYRQFIKKLLIKAVETGDEEVLIGGDETRIDHEFIKSVNRELGSGYKGNLRLGGQRVGIEGGFILRRGKVQINVSLEVLLSQARQELEIELAGRLFGQ